MMWQLICCCLAAQTSYERTQFLNRLQEALEARGSDPLAQDIGLDFLRYLTKDEALTVLVERRELVRSLQEQLVLHQSDDDLITQIMQDHLQTVLNAEMQWLNRTITLLHSAQCEEI